MAELLLLGMTHYPPLAAKDDDMAGLLRGMLKDPGIPAAAKEPSSWSPQMQAEWGGDEAHASAAVHRAELLAGFAHLRAELEAFEPDAIVVWGDDQYENFREDVIPPYALLAYDDIETRPWEHYPWPNVWDEPKDATHRVAGRPDIARWLAERLLDDDVDVAYAYQPLHHAGLAHAFMNTQLYLDYDRTGFPWPMVCMPINCYGRRVIAAKGFCRPFGEEMRLDPPSPTPRRLMAVGGAVARHLSASPWRVALVASSSWSHAFLCDKTWRLHPDTPSDRGLYDALTVGDFDRWEKTTTEAIEDAGQQEVLNWFCLMGAARELGLGAPAWSTFVETWCFNSNKVFAGVDLTGRLHDKVVLVTGTSRNIGGVVAAGFAAAGARVACNDIRAEQAEGCVERIRADGGEAMAVPGDVTDATAMAAAVDAVLAEWGRIDVLLSNAVRFDARGVLTMPLDAYRRQVDIVLGGAFVMTQLVARSMIERDVKGSVIVVLSTAAWQGQAGNIGYCTAKSGLINFARSAAMELAPHGIRVNSFTPTATMPDDPELAQGFRAAADGMREAGLLDFTGQNPWERLPTPSDYVAPLVFLASDDAALMTGTNLTVDGGALAKYWPQAPIHRRD